MSSSCFGYYAFSALDHVVVGLCERTVDFVASTWVDVFAFVVDLGWSVKILLQSLSAGGEEWDVEGSGRHRRLRRGFL